MFERLLTLIIFSMFLHINAGSTIKDRSMKIVLRLSWSRRILSNLTVILTSSPGLARAILKPIISSVEHDGDRRHYRLYTINASHARSSIRCALIPHYIRHGRIAYSICIRTWQPKFARTYVNVRNLIFTWRQRINSSPVITREHDGRFRYPQNGFLHATVRDFTFDVFRYKSFISKKLDLQF